MLPQGQRKTDHQNRNDHAPDEQGPPNLFAPMPATKKKGCPQNCHLPDGHYGYQTIELIVIRIGSEDEEEIVLWPDAWRKHLIEIDPALLMPCWQQVDSGHSRAEGDRCRAVTNDSKRTVSYCNTKQQERD